MVWQPLVSRLLVQCIASQSALKVRSNHKVRIECHSELHHYFWREGQLSSHDSARYLHWSGVTDTVIRMGTMSYKDSARYLHWRGVHKDGYNVIQRFSYTGGVLTMSYIIKLSLCTSLKNTFNRPTFRPAAQTFLRVIQAETSDD